jgi:hypothetical protein
MTYNCKRCGETNEEKFYKSNGAKSKCKKCHTMEVHQVKREMKDKGVQYLGGKCLDCGVEGNPWIFDFHHRDPSEKEFHWGNTRTSNWEALKKELDKCDLLCANCHRTRHQEEWIETLVEHHPYFDK